MRNEWKGKIFARPSSIYLITYNSSAIAYIGTSLRSYGRDTANGEVVASNRDLDGLEVFHESQLVNVIEAGGLSPVATIKKSNLAVECFEILLDDGEELRFGICCRCYDEDLRGTVYTELVKRADVSLAVTKLTQDRLRSIEVDER